MKSRQFMIFTQLEDIEHLVRNIEGLIDIRYYKTGLHDSRNIPTYNSILDTPNVGFVSSGDWNRVENYLIMKNTTPLNIREVPQRTGEMKFVIDQMSNLKSIEFKLGGVYLEKEKVIVAGRVSTISEEKDSNELYKLFTTKIKNEFNKIGTFYVGNCAQEKLKQGWRLVTNEKSPKEYDLAIY